ncbi:Protein S100-A11 [Labeo rohita]|uniref:Protein S100-A11 n=2 Tax=Labeo rohita TaxID=84645 RepID=A0ABQ8LTV8_LABRO|nr:Protein S100-A11 [Labeo rohita]
MESAINVLVSQFKIYAGKDGSANTLSKEEFQSLVTSQLPNFVKNASDPATIDQLMNSLDANNDGELTFLEFWQLIGSDFGCETTRNPTVDRKREKHHICESPQNSNALFKVVKYVRPLVPLLQGRKGEGKKKRFYCSYCEVSIRAVPVLGAKAKMEAAIKTVVSVFLKSSKGKENLGGKEFQGLVKSQLKNIMTGTEDNEAVKNMRQQLDNNQDGKVSFQEYMNLIGYLAQSLSEQRCLEKETQPESSTQETQAEAAANAQAEPPKAEPQAAKEEEKEDEPVVEEAAATEEQKPEEEKKTDVEQEGAKVEENKAEEKNKTEEAS